jgi:hypothetical protein
MAEREDKSGIEAIVGATTAGLWEGDYAGIVDFTVPHRSGPPAIGMREMRSGLRYRLSGRFL